MKKVDLAGIIGAGEKHEELGRFTDRIDGDIKTDSHADFVRVYPNPDAKGFYYRVPKTAIESTHEWAPEELLQAHLFGQRRYRVHLKYGELIQRIEMESILVGKDVLLTRATGCGQKCSASGSCTSSSSSTSKCTISNGVCVSADPGAGC